MKLLIASNNAHKITEIKAIVGDFFDEVLSLREAGVEADVEENGTTFADNARIKAEAICRMTGCAALADDSGLMVDALGGAPGVYSARYGGRHTDAERIALLLENMKDVPDEQRTAQFACAVTCLMPDGRKIAVQGVCPGVILRAPRGEGGFGYDPVFYLPELGKTFAELAGEEKNRISHRGRALREFCRVYREENHHDE